MRAFAGRLSRTGGITAALALSLLAGGVVALAHDDDEHRIAHKAKIRIHSTDEDGNTHEETIDIDGPRPFLGIVSSSHPDGVKVRSVIEGSGAAAAGLEAGDVIVRFNGEPLDGEWDLTKRILASRVGERVELEIERDGKTMNLSAVLGESEDWIGGLNFDFDPGDFDFRFDQEKLQEQMERLHEQLGDMRFEFRGGPGEGGLFGFTRPVLGVQLVEPTPELREHLGGPPDAGVLISKVLEGMPAEEAGLRVGDLIVAVDRRDIEDTGDLIRALREHAGKNVDIEIVRDGSTMRLSVALPEREEDEHEFRGPRA